MLKIVKQDKNKVKEQVKKKLLDAIVTSNSNLIDEIILAMSDEGVLDCLSDGFPEKRNQNSFIPIHFIMTLAVAAKMKARTSLTDIPYAIKDHRVLARLGYNAVGADDKFGWLSEGAIRFLLSKYTSTELFNYYNDIVQKHIYKKMDIETNIHVLDCTKIAVNYDNDRYEGASIAIDRTGEKMRGYKLASLRGIYDDIGLIEEVKFGTAAIHDLKLSEDILRNTLCFHENDILIMDRGFISREMINYLKSERKVDIYIPVKKGMDIYNMAVSIANEEDDWKKHPTRDAQMIHFVSDLKDYWQTNNPDYDVDLNACVVWFEETQAYSVFITTDTSRSAKEIIMTYQLRPEIEEDFRQIKDFWKLEDFKSTKLNVISFHMICTLFGYLFYQLYLSTDNGRKYYGKSIITILKKYEEEFLNYIVLYSGDYFCSMSLKEFIEFRDECPKDVQEYLLEFLG